MFLNYAHLKRMNSLNKYLTYGAIQKHQNYLSKIKEENKILNNHTPYCYEYHDYFLKYEWNNVKYFIKDTTKAQQKLNKDSTIHIDLAYLNIMTVNHLLENKFPEIWGIIISNVHKLEREKISFDYQFDYLFENILPFSLYQLSLHSNGDFKTKLTDK